MHAIAERTGAPVLSAASHPDERRDFAAYLAARQPALLRTAYALTGNRADAEDLLQTALAKLYLSWGRVRDREAVDAYVRRILVNENNSLWRRAFKRREVAVEAVPDRVGADGPGDGARRGPVVVRAVAAAEATGGGGAALLRRAQRGRDRRRARHLGRHREVPGQPGARRPARAGTPVPQSLDSGEEQR